VIGVDFDLEIYEDGVKKERKDFEVIFYILRWFYICRRIECRVCLTRKGLHLKILEDVEKEKTIPLRIWLGDDMDRVELDLRRLARKHYIFFDTLFQYKKNLITKEVSVEKCLDGLTFFKEFLTRL